MFRVGSEHAERFILGALQGWKGFDAPSIMEKITCFPQ
jgi:hypothetical protein